MYRLPLSRQHYAQLSSVLRASANRPYSSYRALRKLREPNHSSPMHTLPTFHIAPPPLEPDINLYANWYTTKEVLPPGLSCHWRDFDGISMFWDDIEEDGSTQAGRIFHGVFGIRGTIEPLAYWQRTPEPHFLFMSDGRYYRWNGSFDCLHCYAEGQFTSHLDFIRRHLEVPSTMIPWPEDD